MNQHYYLVSPQFRISHSLNSRPFFFRHYSRYTRVFDCFLFTLIQFASVLSCYHLFCELIHIWTSHIVLIYHYELSVIYFLLIITVEWVCMYIKLGHFFWFIPSFNSWFITSLENVVTMSRYLVYSLSYIRLFDWNWVLN